MSKSDKDLRATARTLLIPAVGLMLMAVAGGANAASCAVDSPGVPCVNFNPDTLTVIDGSAFTLGIEGVSFDNGSAGGTVIVDWDPAVLFMDAATLTSEWNFPSISIDNIIGEASITAGNFFNPDGNPAGPDFGIATLDFTSLVQGVSTNALGLVSFSPWFWDDGTTIYDPQPVVLGGTVTVNPVPVPAAVWLFGSGILGLVSVARRKKA